MFNRTFVGCLLTIVTTGCGASQSASEESQTAGFQMQESCVTMDTTSARIVPREGGFSLATDRSYAYHFDNRPDAEQSLKIMKTYNVKRTCFAGAMNFILSGDKFEAPAGAVSGEDCTPFNRANVKLNFVLSGRWMLVDDYRVVVDFGIGTQALFDAQAGLAAIQRLGFDEQCFVNRSKSEFKYFKKKSAPLSQHVELSNCSLYSVSPGELYQCSGAKVVAGVANNQPGTGLFETVRCCEAKVSGAAARYSTAGAFVPFYPGNASNCAPNQFVSGVQYDSSGNLTGVMCRGLAANSREVTESGLKDPNPIQVPGSSDCGLDKIMTGVSDVLNGDGRPDGMYCQAAKTLA